MKRNSKCTAIDVLLDGVEKIHAFNVCKIQPVLFSSTDPNDFMPRYFTELKEQARMIIRLYRRIMKADPPEKLRNEISRVYRVARKVLAGKTDPRELLPHDMHNRMELDYLLDSLRENK